MNSAIGKLERVALREVWKHEAYDFTQWLQQNIDVLNAALGLNLVNVDREQAAGTFSIDLVDEDEGGGTVIIENQLEKSNHDHLGKLVTYLTAMAAKAAVASFLLPVIPKLLITASAPNSPRSAKAHIPPDFAERQPPKDGFCQRRQVRHPAWLRQLPARRADWRSKIHR